VFDLPGSSSIALVGRLERAQRNENGAGVDSNYGEFRYLHITVARELAPAGLRSSPNGLDAVLQVYRVIRYYDGCAAEREQAPSPQKQ